MTPRPKASRSPRAALTAAGETTSTGQVGAPAPEGVTPPARPGQRCATEGCGHPDVLHGFARDNRTRTACSVTSGRNATPCGCRKYTAAT